MSSGQLYRASSAVALSRCYDPAKEDAVSSVLSEVEMTMNDHGVYVDGVLLESSILYGPDVTKWISAHAAMRSVRLRVNAILQRAAIIDPCVIEGRDIGTVGFPDAEAKVFLDAALVERARRRQAQQGGDVNIIARAINARDSEDRNKKWGRLSKATDALCLDTTDLTVSEVCDSLESIVSSRLR